MKPRVTIAFVFNESLSLTIYCLECLIDKTELGTYELICVDNNSPESISSRLQQLAINHNFTLIRSNQYLTQNESRNIALRQVQTEYIVFVDNDVEVNANWLGPLVSCADETGAWLVAPLYMESIKGKLSVHMYGGECDFQDELGSPCFFEKHIASHAAPETITPLIRHESNLVEFHTLLINMDAFYTLGELDEKLLNNSQHTDLCYSVRRAGHRIFIEPLSVITHMRPEGRLERVDKEYYSLRWSEGWSEKTLDRLSEKYFIPLNEPGMKKLRWWLSFHRQACIAEYPVLRKVFGNRFHNIFRKYIGLGLERKINYWKYPVVKYAHKRIFEVERISK